VGTPVATLFLRPPSARFFGKIRKPDPVMNRRPFARLAAFRSLPLWLTTAWTVMVAAQEPPGPVASVYSRRVAPRAVTATDPRPASQPVETRAEADGGAVQAERIVAGALATLARAGSLSARLRQKARLGDRVLVGTGRYLQSDTGEDQRYRFESTLEADTESFELLEVCDGLFAWSYTRHGHEAATLQRLDVRRVVDRLRAIDPPAVDNPAPYLGGLQRTLWQVRQWFQFVSAKSGELEGRPVWLIEGRWQPEVLAWLVPDLATAARRPGGIEPVELPDGTPWSVWLAIGKSDLIIRRVEWLAIPGRRPVSPAEVEPIAVLDLFDVELDASVDASNYFYQPATDGLMDLTDQHLQTLVPMRP
jgi:hypothetical protein